MSKKLLTIVSLLLVVLSVYAVKPKSEAALAPGVIISKLLDAYGGEENWINIEGYTMKCKISYPTMESTATIIGSVLLPDKVKFTIERMEGYIAKPVIEIIHNAGEVKRFVDGKETEEGGGVFAERQLLRQFMIDKRPLTILSLKKNVGKMELLGEENVEGKDCYILGFKNSFGNTEKYFIDKETFFLAKIETTDGVNYFTQYFNKHQRFGKIFIPVERESYRNNTLVQKSSEWEIDFRPPTEDIFDF